MKTNPFVSLALAGALLATAPFAAPAAEKSKGGYVDFGKFTAPKSGGEFVEVNLKADLIAMIARLAAKEEPEAAEILSGLEQVRVNVIGLDDGNRDDVRDRVKAIRDDLDGQGWERVVTAQDGGDDVVIFVRTRGAEAIEGVVVTVLDGDGEAVLVNVVGDLKPEQIAEVGERLNIEPLKHLGDAIKKK